jgi:hypothetical protein
MGLFDMFDKSKDTKAPQRPAMDAATDGSGDDMATRLIEQLISVGIDGRGPAKSAQVVADKALNDANGDVEKAINKLSAVYLRTAAGAGFLTGLGGFVTMPVALPANILEFYVVATRMVAGIAHLRGYDLNKPQVRTAVLLTLSGSGGYDVLQKVGVNPITGKATAVALERLPQAALMMVNKGIGFRLIRQLTTKSLAKLGKLVPFAGGVIGGGLDLYLMNRIADNARKEFPVAVGSTL